MYKPYTYIVHDPIADKYYIGSKTKLGCTPDNTKSYMGSPKGNNPYVTVLQDRKHLLVKTVIQTFETAEQAIQSEIDLHEFFNVARNPRFYNKVNQTSKQFNTLGVSYRKGTINSEEHNRKIAEWNTGKTVSDSTRNLLSKAMLGRTWSDERKTAAQGVKKSTAHRENISEGMRKRWAEKKI